MQNCILYIPKSHKINEYDIRFAKALESCGLNLTVIESLKIDSESFLKNNNIVKINDSSINISDEIKMNKIQKYYCSKCQRLFSWREIIRNTRNQDYLIGYYKNDNKFLLFPYLSSRYIPEKWIRIEGKENVYYVDAETYNILKNILRQGKKVSKEVIYASFPDSINSPTVNIENIHIFIFKYFYYEKRCPKCKSVLVKRNVSEIRKNDIVIGYQIGNGNILKNEYGEVLAHIGNEGRNLIYVPEELYSSTRKLYSNEIDIRSYSGISSSKTILKKIARIGRNLKELSGEENDYIDSIAINYVESLKRKVVSEVLSGNYDNAAKLFYKGARTFDLFFIQGARRTYGIPKVAISQLNEAFESLFNSNSLKIKLNEKELGGEWNNFIDLYENAEKLKAKMAGRRHSYNSIVISTVSPLPPEPEMKNILNVKELQIIQGVWHGVKFILKPNMEKIGKYYKNYASKISFLLSKKEAKDIIKKIEAGEYYLGIEGQSLRITREMVTIIPKLPEGYQKGQFKMGEFYLSTDVDNCEKQIDNIIRKVNYQRHKLRMRSDDPVDIVIPNGECNEFLETNRGLIVKRTNARKILFEDSFRVIPFYRSYIRRAISGYLGVDDSVAENIIKEGVENLYLLQVGDLISMPIKNQEVKAKIIEARKRIIEPVDEIDYVYCSLCGGDVENGICKKCGFHYE